MALGYLRPAVTAIEEQQILAVAKLALGDDSVIPMWFGESDIVTPKSIREATVESLRAGDTFYGHKRGLPELQEGLANYTNALYGTSIGPSSITVTSSGMTAIMLAMQATLDAGDNAVVVCPVWPNAQSTVRMLGAEPRYAVLESGPDGRWHLDLEKVQALCDERTRLIFVNSPGNPTGWVMPQDQMRALLAFARERGIWILSDEVYARMVYEGEAAPSFLEVMEPDDPVFVVNSFSKSWAMTGWRMGWLVHSPALDEVLGNLVEFNFSCTPKFVQRGALHAITHGETAVIQMLDHCRRGRDICAQRLPNLARISGFSPPEASFYGFFRIDGTADRTLETCQWLVREAKVGIAPGTAFGPGAEGWYRLCFALEPSRLSEAFDRLEDGLSRLP